MYMKKSGGPEQKGILWTDVSSLHVLVDYCNFMAWPLTWLHIFVGVVQVYYMYLLCTFRKSTMCVL